ncbi:hypothetical protein [Streptomyces sp. HUAS ZL42]|uniref:hypothetical protein n=1 Tax=Streptomyces sp. HUAS ZL42 TaxID=3231715 RepID=UPI00345E16B4
MIRHDADVGAAGSALRAHHAEGGFPIHVVRNVDGAAPGGRDECREEHGVLDAWMRGRSCAALLTRPDHCVFGGVDAASDAGLLFACAGQS